MHKNVLAIVVGIIAVVIGGYFVIFTLPLTLPNGVEDTQTKNTITQKTPAPDLPLANETGNVTETSIAVPAADIQTSAGISTTATTTPVPTSTTTNTVTTVTYNDSGFLPKLINIKSGSSITFKNNSSKPMWVASNDHPAHTIYPEFDQSSAVAKDGSYTFTFRKVGSWGFHNHLSPADGGTVIVTN